MTTVTAKGQITIPAAMVRRLRLKRGERLMVAVAGEELVVRRPRHRPAALPKKQEQDGTRMVPHDDRRAAMKPRTRPNPRATSPEHCR